MLGAPALSDRWYAETLLKLVNTGRLSDPEWNSLLIGVDRGRSGGKPLGYRNEVDPPGVLEDVAIDFYGDALREIVEDQKILRAHPHSTASMAHESWAIDAALEIEGRVVLLPSFELGDVGVAVKYRTMFTDHKTAIDYALLVTAATFWEELCLCRLPTCGKFFLVEPAPHGRPRREYCTDAHRDEFFALGAADRVRKSRARQAKKAK
jgi:hypothetical protein